MTLPKLKAETTQSWSNKLISQRGASTARRVHWSAPTLLSEALTPRGTCHLSPTEPRGPPDSAGAPAQLWGGGQPTTLGFVHLEAESPQL